MRFCKLTERLSDHKITDDLNNNCLTGVCALLYKELKGNILQINLDYLKVLPRF